MNIFCSGIGGIGLSAYAAYQQASGHRISGSDRTESTVTIALRSQGIPVSVSQDGSAMPKDTDLFVYTLALPPGHPESAEAEKRGIRQQTYFEALGELIRGSGKNLIAVCGTHGKSSTTAMLAKVLIDVGKDPSVIVGTKTKDLGDSNWRKGKGNLFVAEACEYHRSFLHLTPTIILLTNADGDHFDAFRDLSDYQSAFQEFVRKLPPDGMLVAHGKDPSVQSIIHTAKERGIRVIDADTFPLPRLQIPGRHMQENAQLVLAVAEALGLQDAMPPLASYAGSWRRMEVKGETPGGVLIIDDYGHHPREVQATLQALAEQYGDRRLICVFQPHTHDRTKKFYGEFVTAFSDADLVVIPGIYDARPKEGEGGVDIPKFVSDIAKGSSVEVFQGYSLKETEEILRTRILKKGDLLLTMGAGDVGKIAEMLLIPSS